MKKNNLMDKVYYNIKHPSSLGSVKKLKFATKNSERDVKRYLSHQKVYTIHKQVRKTFPETKSGQ